MIDITIYDGYYNSRHNYNSQQNKRAVVYRTSEFRTESVDGKQRKGFYVVNYSNEPCLDTVIFLYAFSVLV